jgi:hypothetical protein
MDPARSDAVQAEVRAFAASVAADVTAQGPVAWRKHFSDSPAFFMASEGRLVFPNSASAAVGIQGFAQTIRNMELKWGDDLRVDPLTPDLAVMASSWHELRVDKAGKREDETGFFTAVAERNHGHWQFRDAHWSVLPVPQSWSADL